MLDKRIKIIIGDITEQKTDAIVNAANTTLLGGGGVDGAIHKAAGEAKITRGYRLYAKYVIHTVGPVWNGGKYGEPEKLASCYRNSLNLAVKYKIKTIAFPSISTGAYRYPIEDAAKIALTEINKFLKTNSTIEKIIIVCFDKNTFDVYLDVSRQL